MKRFQIAIIGCGEPAVICALSSIKNYPDKKVAVITPFKNNIDPNFISGRNIFPRETISVFAGKIIKRNNNELILDTGDTINFEKLVLATGSCPITPTIDGLDKDGVYMVGKDPEQIRKVKEKAYDAETIVIYGGGYIGVELCDELLRLGKKVIIVEKSPKLLPSSFNAEFSIAAQKIIEAQGGQVMLNTKVKSVLGIDRVTGVLLKNDVLIDSDFLMICCGSRPNIEVAEKLGVIFDRDRGILVDEYFRTSDKNIYAIGDCAAKFDFFNGELSSVLSFSARLEEAEFLGSNLYSAIYHRGKIVDYLSRKKELEKSIKVQQIVQNTIYGKESSAHA